MEEMAGSSVNKVLIAVDLSENSLKAVDYVGRMLRCHELAEITLLMEQAGSRLTALGIPEKHIRIKIQVCRKPMSISDLILREQQEGGHGTLVVGRRGVSKKEEFLFGSVSSRVVRDAKHCAVWVIE